MICVVFTFAVNIKNKGDKMALRRNALYYVIGLATLGMIALSCVGEPNMIVISDPVVAGVAIHVLGMNSVSIENLTSIMVDAHGQGCENERIMPTLTRLYYPKECTGEWQGEVFRVRPISK